MGGASGLGELGGLGGLPAKKTKRLPLICPSLQQKLLIKLNTVFNQKVLKFRHIINLSMMLFLIFHIFNQIVFSFNMIGKSPITTLPCLKIREKLMLLDKSVTRNFEIFYQACKRKRGVEVCNNMYMIFYPIYPVHMALFIVQHTPKVSE